jgi:hypothetical protein
MAARHRIMEKVSALGAYGRAGAIGFFACPIITMNRVSCLAR